MAVFHHLLGSHGTETEQVTAQRRVPLDSLRSVGGKQTLRDTMASDQAARRSVHPQQSESPRVPEALMCPEFPGVGMLMSGEALRRPRFGCIYLANLAPFVLPPRAPPVRPSHDRIRVLGVLPIYSIDLEA